MPASQNADFTEAYRAARALLKHHGKSYYFSTRLFPRDLQEATCALYAFVRLPDEIVDNSPQGTPAEIAAIKDELLDFLARWKIAYQTGDSGDQILDFAAHIFHQRAVPFEYSQSFLDAMIQDTHQTRYQSYSDLENYMYGSASCVGLMMSHIIGFSAPETLGHATKLGNAMQLTNFLRDIDEDYQERGRVYMPQDELKRFGLSDEDIAQKRFSPAFREFMRFQVARAHRLYDEANAGICLLNKEGRFAVASASTLYRAILDKLEEQDFNPFAGRVATSGVEKVALLGRARALGKGQGSRQNGAKARHQRSHAARRELPMNQKLIVIGGGIGGLAFAALAAKVGYDVTLLEKNDKLGGVANQFEAEGFTFDMGPSWYLMPDVFQNYFDLLGEKVEDYLDLTQLDPSYRIFFQGKSRSLDFYSDLERDLPTFEMLEPGSGPKLKEYLEKSKYQYEIALGGFMYKNYDNITDFFNKQVATEGRELEVFAKMSDYVAKHFATDEVQKVMQYTLVFLGSSPYNTPALYNIMSHIDFNMGVFYPQGGIHQIPLALQKIGEKNGVKFRTGVSVKAINTKRGPQVKGVTLENGEVLEADIVVSNAPVHHTESLLPKPYRDHSQSYWNRRTLAPSALIMYLGVKGKVASLTHHNLLFSPDWKKNFGEIFDNPQWPSEPSLYICAPSKTDPTVAPEGDENLFILVPIPARMEYTQAELESQADRFLGIIEKEMDIPNLRERIIYKRIFSSKDFTTHYNKLGGTALGLAHTIQQTAILRPNNQSKKVKNLLYVGGDTNPGIGMPIQLISAELALKRLIGDKSSGHLTEI